MDLLVVLVFHTTSLFLERESNNRREKRKKLKPENGKRTFFNIQKPR